MSAVPVIDLFAGPGGLNEGFARSEGCDGGIRFRIAGSFEMDPVACQTLVMRAAVRALRSVPEEAETYARFLRGEVGGDEWRARDRVAAAMERAAGEVHQIELGPATRSRSDDAIADALLDHRQDEPWVLIGGPPCQAYSLVGRSRRTNDATFAEDVKHHLYREYLHIIERFRPTVFVMENVKGLLSHRLAGVAMFDRILEDLRRPGYVVRSFVVPGDDPAPSDFVIRAEDHGVPQRRHRVILLGVRSDLAERRSRVLGREEGPSVRKVLGHLPAVRSQVSPLRDDDIAVWKGVRDAALKLAGSTARGREVPPGPGDDLGRALVDGARDGLEGWLTSGAPSPVIQHRARAHMPADLRRYAYLAAMAEQGIRVKVSELPPQLLPAHKNMQRAAVPFADRFRVQGFESTSTTVVSHISKDGHYYIHPDPAQMRSLTVREAARLQTFPDDYYFCGNRTQQYHQVGNAVPPYLARQLADIVYDLVSG